MKYSPLSYVGKVTTPTMMITGEVDFRTPSEGAEQFYSALKLRKVPAALVRVPEASHEIAAIDIRRYRVGEWVRTASSICFNSGVF